jgi:hypothetical protein
VERHDAAPTRVNAMATSCSPITAKHVADEGSVRDSPETLFSFASSISSPSLDNESTNSSISSFSQQTASPESGDAPASDQRSATILPHCTPPVGINNMLAVPRSPSNSRFSCPQCPRKFSTLVKASHHCQSYRHAHRCSNPGCRWSYRLHKDLLRHSATHNIPESRKRYPCPVAGCSDTVSRQDLLKRHVERFH